MKPEQLKPETWTRVRALFEAALELLPEQRDELLARECGGEPEVAREVRAMLRADAGSPRATPMVEAEPGQALASRNFVGATIGGFRVVRQIGAGGMGVVYEAHQERPQRIVALKALAVRFPSERARSRFEDEADILARLRHPAIAQVLAAGSTRDADGDVPWFALELVEQPRPIDRWVRDQRLDVRAIVALFGTVCGAVHYAHQRGVIHRDLKPANVLVDRHGQPKVIDFGIARLLDRDAKARCTRTGEILGTLAYMSPERLERDDAGDDTAADVYALGVILYELLAGCPPFALGDLPPARAMEVLRAADAVPPSRRNPAVPVDLDWITLQAMARERSRRYASVAELAQDLQRYSRHEPVTAGAPSATYRLRKLAWRHRLLLGVATVLIAAVSIGFVVAMLGWRRVEAAERAASRRAEVLTAVNRFHEDVLGGASAKAPGKEVKLADVVAQVAARLENKQFAEPIVEIGLRTAMGKSCLGLGLLQDAERHLLRARALLDAHGHDPHESWGALVANNLALVYEDLGKLELAERELRISLADRIRLFGAGHRDVAIGQSNLAGLLLKRAVHAEALELATQAQRTFARGEGERSAEAINASVVIASALAGLGRADEAERTFAAACELADQYLHEDHPARLGALTTHASFLYTRRQFESALPLFEEVAAARERAFGPAHPTTLRSFSSLAATQGELGQHAAAEATFRRMLAAWRAIGVEDGYDYVGTAQSLTRVVRLQGRAEEAEGMARQLRATAAKSLPEGHWLTGVVTKEHGGCLADLGRKEQAEAALLSAHGMLERAVGARDWRTQKVVGELVALYQAWSRPADAERWQAQMIASKQ